MDADDWDLIARCRAGNAAAFEPLVRRHEGPAFAVAVSLLGDRDDAADAVQDAFVRAWAALGGLRPGSQFGPWFRTILRNLCLDRLRAPRRRDVSLDAVGGRSLADERWAQSAAERHELSARVRAALARLAPEHREVLVLKEMEGLGYAEIAAALGIPEGTVASRLYHARAALKKILMEMRVSLEDLS